MSAVERVTGIEPVSQAWKSYATVGDIPQVWNDIGLGLCVAYGRRGLAMGASRLRNVRTDDANAVDVLAKADRVLATAKDVFDRDRLPVRLVQTLVAVALHAEMPLFDLAARLGGNVSTTQADLQHLGTLNPRGTPGCGFITQRRNPIYPLQNIYELTPQGRSALSALVASLAA